MVTIASDPLQKRLKCLLRHIADVREDTEILGSKLIENGEFEFGKTLIKNGLVHDNSKFEGIEWEELNGHSDHLLEIAIREHVKKNPHHPEYWEGGIHEMPRIFIAEAVCDWHARSTEFGSDLCGWIKEAAVKRYNFSLTDDKAGRQITEFLNLLLERPFS